MLTHCFLSCSFAFFGEKCSQFFISFIFVCAPLNSLPCSGGGGSDYDDDDDHDASATNAVDILQLQVLLTINACWASEDARTSRTGLNDSEKLKTP